MVLRALLLKYIVFTKHCSSENLSNVVRVNGPYKLASNGLQASHFISQKDEVGWIRMSVLQCVLQTVVPV